jgi:hypothetical protein
MVLFVLFISSTAFISFRAHRLYSDIWEQLGITREKGTQNINESFLNGYLQYYGVRNIKNIMAGDKAALAKDLMSYAKQQISSDAFKKHYDELRKSSKPAEITVTVKTKEDIRKEKIAETEKSIKETEENIKKATPDIAKILQPVLDMLKTNLADYKDPKSQMIDLFYQGEKYSAEQRQKNYDEAFQKWQATYPEDSRQFIKSRLQKFVALAKTVDFTAELKEVNGKKKFVKPAYEMKPYDWKQIFRAGKEIILPAIAFAEQWIGELN